MKKLNKNPETKKFDTFYVLRYCACGVCDCSCSCRTVSGSSPNNFAVSSTQSTTSNTQAVITGTPTY